MPFPSVPVGRPAPQLEADISELWSARDTFRRSVESRPEDRAYVFYDGPPFATGLPHYGHLVPSTIKDVVPRYWTMRGHRVERRFGWDTHGLPIEMLMEKELGLSGPTSIREHGVADFNEACRANVLTYTDEWERIIGRLGRWVDFDDDYKTMDPTFMESVWWAFRALWDKGLVYQDFRVMPYSWRLSTSLSNFEANQNYKTVQDPAITVAMPATDDSGDVFLVWTTTPWTLPSNLAIAVGRDIDYVRARKEGDERTFVLARALVKPILGKKATIVQSVAAAELIGRRYAPLFDYFADQPHAFQIIAAPHVTTDSGTGIVHMAPDYGEDDFAACKEAGITVVRSVDDEGRFEASIRDYAGRNVKEADADIIRDLKATGRLVRHDTIEHSYPFCWRSDTPLIYRALPAWFIKVTDLKDRMVEHNQTVRWVPEAVGSKRFGNWLADARDWNISRNRFWGTPIPIWQCDRHESHRECLGSIEELQSKTGAVVTDLHPHKIDHLTWGCASCDGTMRRIADVFDCWFESGSMPYGQNHYPFDNKESFEANFPAQFIAEGLDQTRGWFYTLMVLSTALFDRPPFRNVIVNGMVLAEDGSKMSKSKKNYPPPERIFDTYGADALRAYLIDSPIVRADPLRFSEEGVRDVARTVSIPLQHAWSFFTQYANLDGWSPTDPRPPVAERPELDRWLLSHLQSIVAEVDVEMERYRLDNVVPVVLRFIDDLTNWYIRLSRRRFWRPTDDDPADKAAAYATLYEALVTFTKVLAPFLPFLAEAMYQGLVVEPGCQQGDLDSVHLCDWPAVDMAVIDRELEAAVASTRDTVRLGRRLRERHRLKTRQPLPALIVVHHDPQVRAGLEQHTELLADELNVKRVEVLASGGRLATVTCKANFKRLGRRYGKEMKAAAAAIEALTPDDFATLEGGGTVDVLGQPVELEDVLVRREPAEGVVLESEGSLSVALETALDDALLDEGAAREVISQLQRLRKEAGLELSDRVVVDIHSPDAVLRHALATYRDHIAGEVLATELTVGEGEGDDTLTTVRGDHPISLRLRRV